MKMNYLLQDSQKRKYTKNSSTTTEILPTKFQQSNEPNVEKKNIKKHKLSYSFKEKLKILKKLDSQSVQSVLEEFNLNDRTLRRWKKDRQNIEAMCKKRRVADYRKNREPINQEMEDQLYLWFLEARANGIPISGTILRKQALIINSELGGYTHFKASDGWLDNWKARKNIKSIRITEKKMSADFTAANDYVHRLASIVSTRKLTRAQVFNFDETSLIMKSLPTTTFVCNDENQAAGFKANKERITVAACCNADGTFKLPLLVIGKAAKPRCLKNLSIKNLPVTYRSQKNSWMDLNIFTEWFVNVFVPQVRSFLISKNLPIKALLIIDNCKAYKYIEVDDIEISFLPANVTSIIQPLDQGIIECMKRQYKLQFISKAVDARKKENISLPDFLKKVDIRQVITWIDDAWQKISAKTIYKCWNKLWYIEKKSVATQTEDHSTLSVLLLDAVAVEVDDLKKEENIMVQQMILTLKQIEEYENVDQTCIENWMLNNNKIVNPLTLENSIQQFEPIKEESSHACPSYPNSQSIESDILSSLITESYNILYCE